ncbi:lamin tail domain-containing protein [Candidatus Uhrbacteria bacterium]|nr:lamin tail domain-containing protein [Candidatus Uhrbacteria bacterium]
MKYHINILRLCAVLFFCCFLLSPHQFIFQIKQIHAASSIRLGEIAWAGSSRSTADEWIEIWNMGDQEQSLSGWSLSGAADGDKKIFFPLDASIPAHGIYLISNYSAHDSKSVLTATPNVVTTTLALSNSTLHLVLQDETNTIIDDTGTNTVPVAGSSLPIKISMVRNVPDESWKNATSAINLVLDVSDLGTPGLCDQCTEQMSETTIKNVPEESTQLLDATTSTILNPIPQKEIIISSNQEIQITTSTTNVDVLPETTSVTPTQQQVSPIQTTQLAPIEPEIIKPNYGMLRINEFMPAPKNENEWIEIINLDKSSSISLNGCALHDSTGKIFTFNETHQLNQTTSTYLFIEISNAKLNNEGDTVSLYDPQGKLIDTTSYTIATKGESYIRYPDREGNWERTREPTPGSMNQREHPEGEIPPVIEKITPTATTTTQTITITRDTTAPITTNSVKPIIFTNENPSKTQSRIEKKEVIENIPISPARKIPKTLEKTSSSSNTPTQKINKQKTTGTKKNDPIYLLTDDMFTQAIEGGIHIKLFGTVATPPGLLKAHAFILINPEGRGIRVNVPKKLRLPEQKTFLSITGKLEFDDRNIPRITMGTNDKITIKKNTKQDAVIPKPTDLLTMINEQAWSFIQTTGTVVKASEKKIRLDVDGIEADVYINQPLSYRGSRLDIGDKIQVNGILDLSAEDPRIFPTKNEDIILIHQAPDKPSELLTNAQTKTQYPNWMPIGAAASMVVVTEGAKRLKRHRDLKKLEAKLTSL